MKYILLILILTLAILPACTRTADLGDFLIAQQKAIGRCESQTMEFVGIKMFAENHFSVVCRTTSPVKYYEYPVR